MSGYHRTNLVGVICGLFLASMFVSLGCSIDGRGRGGIGTDLTTTHSVDSHSANVSFAFQVTPIASGPAIPVHPAVFAPGEMTVSFRLLTLNIGNVLAPTTATEQTVIVPSSGLVTAHFGAVPMRSTVAQVELRGASIASFSRFHGARDLGPGSNVITVAPVGSGWSNDLAAHALETAALSPVLFARLPASAAAVALQVALQQDRSRANLQQEMVQAFSQVLNPPRWSLTGEAIRSAQIQALAARGQIANDETTWTAGDTFVTRIAGQNELGMWCSWNTPTEFSVAGNIKNSTAVDAGVRASTLPRVLDWRNKNGRNWLPPVQNQYPHSTGVAFACCSALETMALIEGNLEGVDLSEWQLIHEGQPNESQRLTGGWSFRPACDHLAQVGVVSDALLPYHTIPHFSTPSPGARVYRAASYVLAQGSDGIKQALQEGPVLAGIRVFEDFMRYTGGVYWHAAGQEVGFQSILLVGYDDDRECWIGRNSWSIDWGELGYCRIRYSEAQIDRGYLVRFAYQIPAPAAPASVAVSIGDRGALISWPVVAGATNYNLYHDTIPGRPISSGVRISNVTSPYRLTGLTNDATYYVVITSENSTGESPGSPALHVTPRPPSVLTVASASAVAGDGTATVSWSPIPGAASYNLFWAATPGQVRSSGVRIAGVASPFTHTPLTNGNTYYYQVTAIVNGIETAPSSEISARPWPRIPDAPGNVVATAGNGQVSIAWPPVAEATSYNVYSGSSANLTRLNGTRVTGVATPFIHSGVANGSRLYYLVTAENAAGESVESIVVAATPQLPSPADVSLVRGSTQVTVNWSAVPGALAYNLYYGESATALRTTGTIVRNVQSGRTITGLVNGRSYYFVVTAIDQNVESADSVIQSDQPILAPATNLRVTGNRGRITLTWDAVTGINYGAKVFYSLDGGTSWSPTTHLEGTLSGITPGSDRSLTWVSHQDFTALQTQTRVRLVLNDGAVDANPIDSSAWSVDNRIFVAGVDAVSPDGAYPLGSTIDIKVRFSTIVRVTGTPQLTLETGAIDRTAAFAGGDNTDTLLFRYTVQAGDTTPDLDYAGTNALNLNGGTIRDDVGNAAALALAPVTTSGSLGSARAIAIDGVVPTVVAITSPNSNTTYGCSQTITLNVAFSEPVTLAGNSLGITLDTGAVVTVAPFSNVAVATATYQIAPGQTSADLDTTVLALTNGATLRDAAGNNCSLTIPGGESLKEHSNLAIDAVLPAVVSIVRQTPTAARTNAATVVWRVTFNRALDLASVQTTDFSLIDTSGSLAGEAITGVTQINPSTYDVTASTGTSGDGDLQLRVQASVATIDDTVGNHLSTDGPVGEGFRIDKNPPALVRATGLDTGLVEICFDEPVTAGADAPGCFTISGAGQSTLAANPTSVTVVGTTTYHLKWSAGSMLASSTVSVSVAAGVTDQFGHVTTGAIHAGAPTPLLFIETVAVGDPGNNYDGRVMADMVTFCGNVAYAYRIGKFEVTNEQYCVFLNAVARSDSYGLYSTSMAGMPSDNLGGIDRSGPMGAYVYTTVANMGNKPVNWVSFYGASRFVNWLHNGAQIGGSTETGAYTITGGGDNAGTIGSRENGARYALPTENEWYKAAFYKGGSTNAGYWFSAMQSDAVATKATANGTGDISNPGANVANYANNAVWNGQAGLTTVGSAGPLSASAYGTYDQTGNVTEWCETMLDGANHCIRGCNYSWSYWPNATYMNRGPSGDDYQYRTNGLRIFRAAQ